MGPSVHEIGAHEAGEGEQAMDGILNFVCEAQEQESNQRDSELDAHGVFAPAEKMSDL